ncbi:hypothetical protein PanWU01x14_128830 [Parasponia andersonii]|uniref:Uncharacterized protein n=1 Tax=Parasponia andersonii TaxID=3476 RepID=A0A2P5CRR4_PARAD|nr:hypothetical protein PanWU01x14_128830 [Parasponia andersonii]
MPRMMLMWRSNVAFPRLIRRRCLLSSLSRAKGFASRISDRASQMLYRALDFKNSDNPFQIP